MAHESQARARVWSFVLGFGLVLLATACSWFGLPEREDPEALAWKVATIQQRVLLPRAQAPVSQMWKMVPMSGGPAVYTACVEGDRLFAMNKQAWRGTDGLWPDVALAVSPGACRARRH
jgi:hypothetical protein